MAEAVSRPKEPFLPQIFKGKNSHRNRLKEPMTEKPHKFLSEQDVLRATKSLKHNICVEMLQEGYHRSFQMFFHVLSLEQEKRDSINPSLEDTLPPSLEEQPEKLNTMKQHLTRAECAERSGSWSQVCEQFLSLGLFFSSEQDLWLRLHFLHVCADREQGRSSRAATEAGTQLAETYLQKGELERALQYAECCLSQAEEGSWLDSSGFPLKVRAQYAMCGIFTRFADDPLKSKNYIKATALLHQALNIAIKSGNKQIEGEATYRLGETYQLNGEHSTAKKYLNTYIKICEELDDASGLGKAYRAMAKSLESEGNIEEMVQCLQKLTDQSLKSLPCDLVHACLSLGNYYYNMGELDQAFKYYSKGYDGAEHLKDDSVQLKAQVLLGQAKAQSMIRQFSSVVPAAHASPSALHRLIQWKDSREWDESVNNTTDENNKTPAPQ